MTDENPLISVILPIHNSEKYLREAIDSVFKQNYTPIELIAIDDGSTDGSSQIIKDHTGNIQYYYQTNQGPAAARNLGIQKANGEFVTFIDGDDLWPDDKLKNQMGCFEKFPETEIVQGLVKRVDILQPDGYAENNGEDQLFIHSNLGAMLIRRTVFDKIGLFDKTLTYHSDTDFWFRARESGIKIMVDKRVALIYRIHGQNHTSGKTTKTLGFAGILKKSMDRRRNQSGEIKSIPELPVTSDEQD
jgi:glycosyltransferase involved in cell wall biosynthesis